STRAWIASVSRDAPPPVVRPSAPAAGALAPELPPASPDTLAPEPPPGLVVDPDLQPPIPRAPVDLRMPASLGGREHAVELDVHVDERGYVNQATWAGGSAD